MSSNVWDTTDTNQIRTLAQVCAVSTSTRAQWLRRQQERYSQLINDKRPDPGNTQRTNTKGCVCVCRAWVGTTKAQKTRWGFGPDPFPKTCPLSSPEAEHLHHPCLGTWDLLPHFPAVSNLCMLVPLYWLHIYGGRRQASIKWWHLWVRSLKFWRCWICQSI